jgi:hypothetical protein
MELFLPSLLVLLFSAVIVLTVIPRVTPFFIFVITVIFFIIAVYSHYMMFKHEYVINTWRDTFAKSVPAVIGSAIAIGILISTLNIFTNIKITPPSFSVFQTKPQAIVKGYSNIPIEKIIELEKQL